MVLDENQSQLIAQSAHNYQSLFIERETVEGKLTLYGHHVRDTGYFAAKIILQEIVSGEIDIPVEQRVISAAVERALEIRMGIAPDSLERFNGDEMATTHVSEAIANCLFQVEQAA